MRVLFGIAALSLAVGSAFAQSVETFDPSVKPITELPSGPSARVPNAVLFQQGPLTDSTNGSPPVPISILNSAAPFNYTTLGGSAFAAFRLADDFVVPAGRTWRVDSITVYGYQTGVTTATINAATLQVWNAPPVAGGTPLFGNTTTNRLATAALAGSFRVTNTTLTDRARALQAITIAVSPPLVLTAGTYWVDFNAGGSGATGPFFPPVVPTLAAPAPTGNALQLSGTPAAYAPFRMGLTTDPVGGVASGPQQGLPFIVEGTDVVAPPTAVAVPVPTVSIWGKLALGLMLGGLALVVLRRRV